MAQHLGEPPCSVLHASEHRFVCRRETGCETTAGWVRSSCAGDPAKRSKTRQGAPRDGESWRGKTKKNVARPRQHLAGHGETAWVADVEWKDIIWEPCSSNIGTSQTWFDSFCHWMDGKKNRSHQWRKKYIQRCDLLVWRRITTKFGMSNETREQRHRR